MRSLAALELLLGLVAAARHALHAVDGPLDPGRVAPSAPADPQPSERAGQTGSGDPVAGPGRPNVPRLDEGAEARFLEVVLDPLEVGGHHAAGTRALDGEADREGDRDLHRLRQGVQRGAVHPGVGGDDLDLVPARAHLHRAAQHAPHLVLDRAGGEEFDAGTRTLVAVDGVKIAARRRGRGHVPQDALRRRHPLDRVGPEEGGAAVLQGADEASLEAAVGETGEEEGGGAQRGGGAVVLQDPDGGFEHVRVVGQVAGGEEILVALKHCRDEAFAAGGRRCRTTAERPGPDAPEAQGGHRFPHRVAEPHLFGEAGEAGPDVTAHRLVDGPLHERLLVEGIDDCAARGRQGARTEFRCEGS